MKDIAYYASSNIQRPKKSDFERVFCYRAGKVVFEGTSAEYSIAHRDGKILQNYVAERVIDDDGYREAQRAYNQEQARLRNEFKQDLFVYHGVVDHPQADKCYDLAWDYSDDSGGLREVAETFDDLVVLIKG